MKEEIEETDSQKLTSSQGENSEHGSEAYENDLRNS